MNFLRKLTGRKADFILGVLWGMLLGVAIWWGDMLWAVVACSIGVLLIFGQGFLRGYLVSRAKRERQLRAELRKFNEDFADMRKEYPNLRIWALIDSGRSYRDEPHQE